VVDRRRGTTAAGGVTPVRVHVDLGALVRVGHALTRRRRLRGRRRAGGRRLRGRRRAGGRRLRGRRGLRRGRWLRAVAGEAVDAKRGGNPVGAVPRGEETGRDRAVAGDVAVPGLVADGHVGTGLRELSAPA